MPKMINPQTGQVVNIPNDEIEEAYRSGTFDFDPQEEYTVLNSNGDPVTYKGSAAGKALDVDMEFKSDQKVYQGIQEQAMEDAYGGIGGGVQAGVEGLARGLTLGTSDVLFGALDQSGVAGRREVNPGISTVTEIAGAIVPSLLTGGAGGIGAAGTAAKILRATPSAKALALGARVTGMGAEAGLLAKTGYAIAGGALEGSLFGGGQGISELALSDKPLSADRVVSVMTSDILTGAAYGGAIGGGLSVAGSAYTAGASAAKRVPNKLNNLFSKGAKAADEEIEVLRSQIGVKIAKDDTEIFNLLEAAREESTNAWLAREGRTPLITKLDDAIKSFDKAEKSYRAAIPAVSDLLEVDVTRALAASSKSEYSKAMSVMQEYQLASNRVFGAMDEIYAHQPFTVAKPDFITDYQRGLPTRGIDGGFKESVEKLRSATQLAEESTKKGTLYERAQGLIPEKYQRLFTGTTKEVEEEVASLKVGLSKKFGDFEDISTSVLDDSLSVRKGLAANSAFGSSDDALRTIDDKIANYKNSRESIEEYFGSISQGDDRIDMFKALADSDSSTLSTELNKIDDFLKATDDLAAHNTVLMKEMSPGIQATLPDITGTRNALNALKEAAEGKNASGWDLGDILAVADILGIDNADIPIISKVLSIPGVGEILALRALKKGGGRLAHGGLLQRAGLGGKATNALAAKSAAAADGFRRGVSSVLRGGGKTLAAAKRVSVPATLTILNSTSFAPSEGKKYAAKTKGEAFKRRSDELLTMSAQPQLIHQYVASSVGPIPQDLLVQIQMTQQRKIEFLASKLPKDPNLGRIIPKEFKPSDVELKKFSRYLRAAENPMSVLEDMKNGRLTQEAAEAVRVIYPTLFADMQRQILEEIPALKQKLSYKQRIQISRLFGVPVDDTMNPEFIAFMQQDFAGDSEEMENSMNFGAVKPTSGAIQKLSTPGMTSTIADKLTGPGLSQ